ncbi:Maf family protein [Paenactinomyces guangxiensis]|uniref:dTTP/UTP pyrophosphatase n=1 Tax=Paenactinomyces guangxiensis TaxID=1490290 RepID=A0A7W1WUF4_9BACL|nr:Maf family protein [Paenactinomyces guangxiensis]MBA4496152.1 septum formation inhibitor Maf [Paenactinomyces guangxiensis]MBH8593240.1 septum formation inhibitor Maf [Paenactinomyces guangxiensis]
MQPELVLASGSPRRQELLSQLGLSFRIQTSQADETVEQNLSPATFVEQLALKKAKAVARSCQSALVIGADTVVVLDDEILGKPGDQTVVKRMLTRLQGREHQVYTGIALVQVHDEKVVRELTDHKRTTVWMRRLTPEKIEWYAGTGEPLDKAGAYGIQGFGACFVEKIEGCYFNVVGLSISLLDEMMEKIGFSLVEDFRSGTKVL